MNRDDRTSRDHAHTLSLDQDVAIAFRAVMTTVRILVSIACAVALTYIMPVSLAATAYQCSCTDVLTVHIVLNYIVYTAGLASQHTSAVVLMCSLCI